MMKTQLPSGNYMPLIGFGTFQIRGRALIRNVLDHAFAAGYRQIGVLFIVYMNVSI
jgi:diketogulonate reductase-like aldo/keto reductase